MPSSYVIALLLCRVDNCDLVRLEPGVTYPSYEACEKASAANLQHLSDLTKQYREPGREGDLICLRELAAITEVEEDYVAAAAVRLHELPTATSKRVGTIAAGQHALVTGIVQGTDWLRVALEDGSTAYAFGEGLRKAPSSSAPPGATMSAISPPEPRPIPQPEPATREPAQAAALPRPSSGATRQGEFQDCEHCPVMVKLPAGRYIMGSNGDPTERPPHSVAIAAFAIGKFETTEAEWKACIAGGGCKYQPAHLEGSPDRPMTNLSWDDANEYVRWLSAATGKPYRFPTEAEWEYAARAGTSTRFPWGAEIGVAKANCKGCGGPYDPAHPAKVAQFEANAWGLFGMSGGVAEWTQDCWHRDYTGAPSNGTAWIASPCPTRVLRGGSWMNPPTDLTVSSRNFYDSSVRYIANGLRVATDLR